MMSIKRLLAGECYRYLLRTVADGEAAGLDVSSPMTRYYTEAGTPPGTWTGSGLAGLGGGQGLAAGTRVAAEQMAALFRDGQDPVNGDRLTRQSMATRPLADRIRARIKAIPDDLDRDEWQRQAKLIEKVETDLTVRRPVAGFDLTFSPAKSVSILWALADLSTRQRVAEAHHAAVADVLALIERDVARTRIGSQGVAQVETRGIIAAAFDHYESRAGDPQLHTHVVIANRVQTQDGRWRTLDSHGALFPAVVALSETYDAFLADHLTRTLGVAWEPRGTPRKDKNQRWELAGISDELISEFSQRARAIHDDAERRIDAWTTEHGRRPDDAAVLRLRQQATIDTRPDKELHSLHELTQAWRDRASRLIGRGVTAWADGVINRTSADAVGAVSSTEEIAVYAETVLARLEHDRSTWRRWNIHAEAARVTMAARMATPGDRERLLKDIVAEVERRSVLLTAASTVPQVAAFVLSDGSSAFEALNSRVFTSATLLDAETRLLQAGRSVAGPTASMPAVATGSLSGLADDQVAAVTAITTSGRELDVMVGPAGSGKTAALAALRTVWEAEHGAGSVIGLAPSSSAAQVLADNLCIPTDNTAKWLTEAAASKRRLDHAADLDRRAGQFDASSMTSVATTVRRQAAALRAEARRWSIGPGHLVILDEASLAGTLDLDSIASQARTAGAKVLLVGDWGQLSAVQAGGALGMLVRERPWVPELTSVRRFTHAWERDASTRLRVGDPTVIDEYDRHGAISEGDRSEMIDAAYAAWRADEASGLRSLLIAGDNASVQELNGRAREDRVLAGTVEPDGVLLHDGSTAGEGDRVVARRNERRLSLGRGWVKNGDQFDVLARQPDGSLVACSASGAALRFPAAYVRDDLELAYATTAHRAQGMTVATCHLLVTSAAMTREVLYVGMSRGRQRNCAYVCTDLPVDEYDLAQNSPSSSGTEVLAHVLSRTSAELSAHETARAEHEKQTTIAALAAQYETIAAQAEDQRWSRLLNTVGATPPAVVGLSNGHRAFIAACRYADALELDIDAAVPQLAAIRPLPIGVDELLSELTVRVERWIVAAEGDRTPERRRFIAGLIPAVVRVDEPTAAAALKHAEQLIDTRARELVDRAVQSHAPWLAELGPRGDGPSLRAMWDERACTVAAYRDRYGVLDATRAIGGGPGVGFRQRQDHGRAARALDASRQVHWPARDIPPLPIPRVERYAPSSLGV